MQGDTLAPCLFIICPDFVLWTSIDLIKENGFTLKEKGKMEMISWRKYDRYRPSRCSSASCLDFVLWTSIDLIKENGFTLKKARWRWYPTENMTDADLQGALMLLANALTRATG